MSAIDDLDCPTCAGSGRLAPNGDGLYVFLAANAARVDGFERAIARATELRALYIAETGDANDDRARLCEQEIAACHRSAEFHETAAEKARANAATCLRCHGCGGPAIVKTCGCGHHHTAEGWLALDYRGQMDNGDDVGCMLELRDCTSCGSTIAIAADRAPVRRAA